jgi:hypothetical protein
MKRILDHWGSLESSDRVVILLQSWTSKTFVYIITFYHRSHRFTKKMDPPLLVFSEIVGKLRGIPNVSKAEAQLKWCNFVQKGQVLPTQIIICCHEQTIAAWLLTMVVCFSISGMFDQTGARWPSCWHPHKERCQNLHWAPARHQVRRCGCQRSDGTPLLEHQTRFVSRLHFYSLLSQNVEIKPKVIVCRLQTTVVDTPGVDPAVSPAVSKPGVAGKLGNCLPTLATNWTLSIPRCTLTSWPFTPPPHGLHCVRSVKASRVALCGSVFNPSWKIAWRPSPTWQWPCSSVSAF